MKKINFIGALDKTDLVIYVGKILTEIGYKILVIDATVNQKAKYLIPSIENESTSYVTNYEGVDIAVGFTNYTDIKRYLKMPDTSALTYDYVLLDIDNPELIDTLEIYDAYKNYFVTSSDLFSLKRGLEVIRKISIPINVTKVYFSNQMSKAEDDYLNFLSSDCRIKWQEDKIYFPFLNEDRDIIIENQRVSKIKFKGLSTGVRDSLIYIAQDISGNSNGVKKAYKQIERGV